MKKNEFLYKLENLLKKANVKKYQNYLTYYSEYIDDLIEEGYPEEQSIQKVGHPVDVFEKIINETDDSNHHKNLLKPILFWVSSPIWFPILLSIGIIIAAFVFSIFIFSFTFLLNSIWLILGSFISLALKGVAIFLIELGLGILSIALSLFFWELLIPVTKVSKQLFIISINQLSNKGV